MYYRIITFFIFTLFSVQISHSSSEDFIPVPELSPSEHEHIDQILSEKYSLNRAQELFDFFLGEYKNVSQKAQPYLSNISKEESIYIKKCFFNFLTTGFRVTSMFGLSHMQVTRYQEEFIKVCMQIPEFDIQAETLPIHIPSYKDDYSLMTMLCTEIHSCAMIALTKSFSEPIHTILINFIQAYVLEVLTHCISIECCTDVDKLECIYKNTCSYAHDCSNPTCQNITLNLAHLHTIRETNLYKKLMESAQRIETNCAILHNVIAESARFKREQITGGRSYTDDTAAQIKQIDDDEEETRRLITPLDDLHKEIENFLAFNGAIPNKRQRKK